MWSTEDYTAWFVTGSLNTVYNGSWFDSIQQKGYQDFKSTPNNTTWVSCCDLLTYKDFVVLEHWLVVTRHLPDLENLHVTLTFQHVIRFLVFRKSIILFRLFLCWETAPPSQRLVPVRGFTMALPCFPLKLVSLKTLFMRQLPWLTPRNDQQNPCRSAAWEAFHGCSCSVDFATSPQPRYPTPWIPWWPWKKNVPRTPITWPSTIWYWSFYDVPFISGFSFTPRVFRCSCAVGELSLEN